MDAEVSSQPLEEVAVTEKTDSDTLGAESEPTKDVEAETRSESPPSASPIAPIEDNAKEHPAKDVEAETRSESPPPALAIAPIEDNAKEQAAKDVEAQTRSESPPPALAITPIEDNVKEHSANDSADTSHAEEPNNAITAEKSEDGSQENETDEEAGVVDAVSDDDAPIDHDKYHRMYKNESRSTASGRSEDDSSQESDLDSKSLRRSMKSKLCTLLNHTPLVMQVKNVDWIAPESSSPVLLNSEAKNDEGGEGKTKLKIVSDEKSNLSHSEIETMLHSGKLMKKDEKLTLHPQKQNAEEGDEQSTSTKCADEATASKKECLKRIQAKMYENLKKVMEEVESHPIRDKATFSIKPFTGGSALEDVRVVNKTPPIVKPTEKPVKEKPCYMSTYRERKVSQEDSDETKTAEVINLDKESEETVTIPKKRGRSRSSNLNNNSEDKDYGIPLKKTIAKRFSESLANATSTDEVKTPRKRGRPRKNPIQTEKIEESTRDPENNKSIDASSRGSEKVEEAIASSSKQEPADNTPEPPKRRRGRPPKIRPVEVEKESGDEEEGKTEIDEVKTQNDEVKTQSDEVKTQSDEVKTQVDEVKTPKRRGRRTKAELEALRKKVETTAKVEEAVDPETYTKSKISGRKRKIVNYSLLNGEDSDSEQVPGDRVTFRRTPKRKERNDEDEDKSSRDEHASGSKRNKRSKTREDEEEAKPEQSKPDPDKTERQDCKSDINGDDSKTDASEGAKDNEARVSDGEERLQQPAEDVSPDAIKCSVCEVTIERSLWAEHKRKVHSDLAWNSEEKPLVVQVVETLQ